MRVAVVGLGYVGAVSAACLADAGHDVIGVDTDAHKVGLISSGRSPIIEPRLEELIASGRTSGRLTVTTELRGVAADVTIVCVGTPSRADGSVDLGFIESVARELGTDFAGNDAADGRFPVVMFRSTIPPGTVEDRLVPILESASGQRADVDFGVAMCPEFLREGSGVDDFLAPPFTVTGVRDEQTLSVLKELFASIDRPLHALPITAAESLKYACNAFHAVKATFANEIGRLLQANDIDARDVMRVFCEDDQLNISKAYLRPGFAFGGSCLPKDLRALMHLARMQDVDVPMIASVMASNESHLRRAVRRVLETGAREVALLGLSFKAQTDDLRESPYVELAETLTGKGVHVRIYDPIVNPDGLFGTNRRYVETRLPHLQGMLATSPAAALDGCRTAIVATTDPAVVQAIVEARPDHVLDLCGRLGSEIEALPGYEGVAW